MKGLWKEIDCR